ncbi:hypothetical protein FD754_021464 [Muntiacus muntjak]|uniref:T-complex protein 1 subunit alpha n=1 Tax=Muntiacus muntjak TaxID=9888 RepID=A0A5N3V6F7_MUNMU|nr:hypothetical protein FD754_021464 [Muntiacus muntjak]
MRTEGLLFIFRGCSFQEVICSQKVMVSALIANTVKGSFGSVGLDKMLVDDIGDETIINHGATILKLLEIEHPTVKVSSRQRTELLKNADELVKQKIYPTSEAVHYISENLIINTDELGRNCLINTAKIIGINALLSIKYIDVRAQPLSPVNAIDILKTHRRSQMKNMLINAQLLQKTKMKLGVQVVITDPVFPVIIGSNITKEQIQKIVATGANVILTTGGICDMCLKYFVETGATAVGRSNYSVNPANLEGEETFDASMVGQVEEVVQETIFILPGANDSTCDEMELSFHSALCVVKRILESQSVVPGGSAVEAAFSLATAEFARSLLVILNALTVNAAQDSTDLAQVNPERVGGGREVEPTIVKVNSLKFATETAIILL